MNEQGANKRGLCAAFLLSLAAFGLLMILFYIKSYAPFGTNSLAIVDADIQYLDFFSWYRACLRGEDSAAYSFSIGLGQPALGVFAYYLASPVNLLVLFFDRSGMHSFFDIAAAVRLAACAGTMFYFLIKRFAGLQEHQLYAAMLGVCYAFMNYNITQASNIMWLDGVYMLPLILLGVYRLVDEGRWQGLSASVGLSILFNWYTGGINCLFAAAWFVFELALAGSLQRMPLRAHLLCIAKFAGSMLLGVMLSAALFLPNVLQLTGGKGSSFDWHAFRWELRRNILIALQGFTLGSESEGTRVSLYAGSLPAVGCIAFFFSRSARIREKLPVLGLLVFSLLTVYSQPLILIFSLLKSADSYWCRYSYLPTAAVIFTAAYYFSGWDGERSRLSLPAAAAAFSLSISGLYMYNHSNSGKNILITAFFAVSVSLAAVLAERCRKRAALTVLLLALFLCEQTVHVSGLMDRYHNSDTEAYSKYASSMASVIDDIRSRDPGLYRITEAGTRGIPLGQPNANLNDSMAYGFMGISSYTSYPDNVQLDFLAHSGYRTDAGCVTVVAGSVLPTDTLLGARYYISPEAVPGYEPVSDIAGPGDRHVYLNQYALPPAFCCSPDSSLLPADGMNCFEYINAVYSTLLGRDVSIFTPAAYEKTSVSDTEAVYHMTGLTEDQAVYVDFPWYYWIGARIGDRQEYARWLSPSVVYVPSEGGECTFALTGSDLSAIYDERIYIEDIGALREAASVLAGAPAQITRMSGTRMELSADAAADCSVIITVPVNDGWRCTVNGAPADIEAFDGTFISIPVSAGHSEIVLSYSVPGLTAGCVITAAAVMILLISRVKKMRCTRRSRVS